MHSEIEIERERAAHWGIRYYKRYKRTRVWRAMPTYCTQVMIFTVYKFSARRHVRGVVVVVAVVVAAWPFVKANSFSVAIVVFLLRALGGARCHWQP